MDEGIKIFPGRGAQPHQSKNPKHSNSVHNNAYYSKYGYILRIIGEARSRRSTVPTREGKKIFSRNYVRAGHGEDSLNRLALAILVEA
jgi:hypothetical protein